MNIFTLSDLKQPQRPDSSPSSVDMSAVASVILGGGEGTRLRPLTLTCCKPAISFGGKYCLIDIPISNSIHANCGKIFVLTQFLSSSLHKHISQTYKAFNHIDVLTAEQRPAAQSWYQGTADAVRQNLDYLLETPADYFLILSGDQLYHLDFKEMVLFARESNADVVVAALPVSGKEASRMGILKTDADHRITHFHEKPTTKQALDQLLHLNDRSKDKRYLGSMGIYLFKRQALIDFLRGNQEADFGKHIIPKVVNAGKAAAYIFHGYWEDIGTIETFYEANLKLTSSHSPFNFYDEAHPLISPAPLLPPTQFSQTVVHKSLVCDGCLIEAREISNSIIGPRTIIQKGTVIEDSYLMGNDYYPSKIKHSSSLPPHPHIGQNCLIQKCIIDKNASIGNDVQLMNRNQLTHFDGDGVCIRDGIIIVSRGASIPDGFTL